MPVEPNYQIPPWIRGANPLEAVEAGASLGARIAESNQRAAMQFASLQQQQAEFQQRMAMQEQQLEQQQAFEQQKFQAQQQTQQQNQLRDDQQLQIENAYKQAQLGLAKQKLDMTHEAAAASFNEQAQYLKDRTAALNDEISKGTDPEVAAQRATVIALQLHPGLKVSPTAVRAMTESAAGEWKKAPGGQDYYREPKGVIRFPPKQTPTAEDQESSLNIKDATKEIDSLTKQLDDLKTAAGDKPNTKQTKQIRGMEQRLMQLQSMRHQMFQKKVKPQAQTPTQTGTNAPQSKFGAPSVGQVVGGYTFHGGDPADQKNWKLQLQDDEESDTEE